MTYNSNLFYHFSKSFKNVKFWIICWTLIWLSQPQLFAQKQDSVMHSYKVLNENEKTKLFDELGELASADQKYRKLRTSVIEKYGKDSKEHQENTRLWNLTDSINLIKIDSLLVLYGYEAIIDNGAESIFIIIQHADLQRQLTFIPLFKAKAKQGKMDFQKIALMEDRINVRTGKKQVYGTQICKNIKTAEQFVCALEDPETINLRRAELDLPAEFLSMAAYCKYFGIKWNLEEYKKRLPEFEAIQKEQGNW